MRLTPCVTILFYIVLSASATYGRQSLPLFGNKGHVKLVQKCVDRLYNLEFDKANALLDSIKAALPGHPVSDMIEAMMISWAEMPFNTYSPGYQKHVEKLQEVMRKAEEIQKRDVNNQEGIFFAMSAHALLTEYHANDGDYIKAVNEARQTYTLVKKGFDLAKENDEFLFAVGLYNYFREKYPEKHPNYKPFLWFFKSGNKELGLKQLDQACRLGTLTKVEATLYTSYIYMRYEHQPGNAIHHLKRLCRHYPDNPFFKTKLAEALVLNGRFGEAIPIINVLSHHADPYYRMSANLFSGIMEEKNKANLPEARRLYQKGLYEAEGFEHKGGHYKSMIHLGLGRIYLAEGKRDTAKKQFEQALEWATSDEVENEAKKYLKN